MPVDLRYRAATPQDAAVLARMNAQLIRDEGHRNPMSIAMPAASPVPAAELAAFQVHAAPLIARLELLANSNLALLE